MFQYVGERAARCDRVFVWGFSFSGALGVPTFVLPDSGQPLRRIQPVPYRLEMGQKVRAVALPSPSLLAPHPRACAMLPEVGDAGCKMGGWEASGMSVNVCGVTAPCQVLFLA